MEKQLNVAELKTTALLFNPTQHLVSQSDIDNAKDFVRAVKLIEDTFGSSHSSSLAANEVLKTLGLGGAL